MDPCKFSSSLIQLSQPSSTLWYLHSCVGIFRERLLVVLAVHESIPLFQKAQRELKRMSSTVMVSNHKNGKGEPCGDVMDSEEDKIAEQTSS